MKKVFQKVLVAAMVVMFAFTFIPVTQADAAVKLNATKKTVNVGESFTLKVSGSKSKVKWSSTKKSVASVTSKGKVTAKQAGSATITAKVGGKTLKCNVTVNAKFSASEATKKISAVLKDTGKGVVAILKNNNKIPVSVTAKLAYFKDGKMIDTASDANYAFEKGAECALFFHGPHDNEYNDVSYDDYKLTLSVSEGTNLVCGQKGIDVKSDFGADNVSAEVTNSSGNDLNTIQLAVVFYDSNGDAIGYEYHYAECLTNGSVDYLSFNFPYDDNYSTIVPASYQLYVNSAYTYTWMK